MTLIARLSAPGVVAVEIDLPGPMQTVWDHLVDTDLRGRWLAAGPLEGRVGGHVAMRFRHADLSPLPDEVPERHRAMAETGHDLCGTVTAWAPPRRLAFTWHEDEGGTDVDVALADAADGGVRLTLTHRGLASPAEEIDVAAGWHTHLTILRERLAGRVPPAFWRTHAEAEAAYARAFGASPAVTTKPGPAAAALVDGERLWRYLEPFTTTVRSSGSPAEAEAFAYAEGVLRGLGYEVRRLDHDGYVSLPGAASLTHAAEVLPCITHALAAASDGTRAPLADAAADGDLTGKVALARGLASPGAVRALVARGALGAVFVNAAQRYEMCVSPVWGSPDPDALARLPGIPVVSVAGDHEARLVAAAARGDEVVVRAEVVTGWRTLPLLEATLRAANGDGSLVLFSGHVDGWHLGAMDNGGANATMLEVATVMARRRAHLARDLRLAFWSGHSHGRYAGSQHYADTNYVELRDRALLHVNVDCVGGAASHVLTEAACMAETFELAAEAVAAETGQAFAGVRYERAGDQSFWGHGVSSVFMGLSEQERGDGVAGEAFARLFGASRAGGFGWWWHTPEDTIDKLDPPSLLRDARVYARVIDRACCESVAPLRHDAALDDLAERLAAWQARLGGRLDLGPLVTRVEGLREAWPKVAAGWTGASARDAWRVQKRLARALVPLAYVAGPRHQHDPALSQPPLPLLSPLAALADAADGDAERHARVAVRRALNGAIDLLDEAAEALGVAAR